MSAPRVRVSRAALEKNIAAAAAGRRDVVVDLRRDACGHGAATVAESARAAGVTAARTDEPADAVALGMHPSAGPALDLDAVYGLNGRGAPALTFAAPVLQTKRLRAGDGVSYGYRHRATSDTNAALISGGYAQGVARAIGGTASVRFGDAERPIIGRVAMDVCVVDIGSDLELESGAEAVYFGGSAPHLLDDWVRATGWSALELVAVVGLSAPREVVP